MNEACPVQTALSIIGNPRNNQIQQAEFQQYQLNQISETSIKTDYHISLPTYSDLLNISNQDTLPKYNEVLKLSRK